MAENEIIRCVQQQTDLPIAAAFDDPAIPIAHMQATWLSFYPKASARHSSAVWAACPLYPQFDALSQQGILLDRMYATNQPVNLLA